MGPVLGAVGKFIAAIFIGTSAGGAYALAVNVARLGLLAVTAKLSAPKLDLTEQAVTKALTIRDPIAPQKFIYGEDMVSGPLNFANVAGTDNSQLFLVVNMVGHECDSVVGYRVDDTDVPLTDLSGAEEGNFIGGKFNGVGRIDRKLGTLTQTLDNQLDTHFPTLFQTNHTGRGWAYCIFRFDLIEGSEDVFKTQPQNVRTTWRGKKVYDPRLDDTNGGSGPHRLADSSTWEWSDNSALCLADYIRDDKFGMREEDDRVNWPKVITAADICDELVTVPPASPTTTQNRYTCNATFNSTQARGEVKDELLNSMLGRMIFSQGQWHMWAGAAITPDVTLTEANLRGSIQLEASTPSRDRYNRVRGKFIDASRNYVASQYPEQRSSTFETEDGGELLEEVADFLSCNNDFEAQRKAIITLKKSRNQRVLVFVGNFSCFRIQPGTTVLLTIAELGFAGEKFFVTEWKLTPDGVDLTMVEEDDTVWNDPVVVDYTVRSPTGALTFADQGVPAPTSFSGTPSGTGGFLLTWTNPPESTFDVIEVWASEDNVRGNADIVATVRANHYFDQQSGAINKYYWIRARNKFGQVSNYTPDLTTTTVVGVAALPISLPDYAVKFNYDDLDTSGRAAGKSRYAMLTDRDVNTSGSRDNFQNTDGILINKTDFDSAVHDGFFGTLRLAERIAFVVSPTRWYLFTIDEIMGVVGTGAAMAYKVGVTYIFSRDADPGVNIPTRSRTPVTFEFQRSEFSDIIAIADPDFDLSTGSVGAFVSGTYWLEITADDGRIDWRPGDGDDGSNAIDIYTAGGDTGDKAFVESRPMIKASAETWQFIVKYKTVTQTASGVMFAKFVAAGWANPLDENPTAPVQSGQITAQLPESFNTWTIVRVVVPTDGLDTARYWSFRLGYQQGFLDFEKYRFDSIYVSAVPKAFGDVLQNTVVSGLVPESNTSTDAGKVLRADGSWVVQGGAAADILVGTASSGNNLIGTKGTVVSVGWDASVEDTDEITGFDDGESDIVITNAGELLLDASVAVIDAGVNNRTTLALRVRLRNSSNVEQYLYYVDSTYIRDDANTYDSGLMAVQLELHVAAGDKLQIQSEVLDAQTTSGTMNASTTYSKLRLQKIS